MNKLKTLVVTALAAATVGTGALAAAPSASAEPTQQPTPTQTKMCVLHTQLGDVVYPPYSEIVVISGRKWLTYRCNNGTWVLVRTLGTPTPTYTGSLATVVTRV
jgi:hypothetical protein